MNKFVEMLKKVDKKMVLGIAGGAMALGSALISNQTDKINKHEAAEEAAKIVMEKLSSKES